MYHNFNCLKFKPQIIYIIYKITTLTCKKITTHFSHIFKLVPFNQKPTLIHHTFLYFKTSTEPTHLKNGENKMSHIK